MTFKGDTEEEAEEEEEGGWVGLWVDTAMSPASG